MSGERL